MSITRTSFLVGVLGMALAATAWTAVIPESPEGDYAIVGSIPDGYRRIEIRPPAFPGSGKHSFKVYNDKTGLTLYQGILTRVAPGQYTWTAQEPPSPHGDEKVRNGTLAWDGTLNHWVSQEDGREPKTLVP